jgi:catechol 2,3-dioxygenase-like lactoylglutathione lyase family enzyme
MSARIQALTPTGILTDDIERTALLWRRMFGLARVGRRPTWYAPEEGVLSTFLALPGGVVEPLQPATCGLPIELIDSSEMGGFVTQEELDAFVGGGAAPGSEPAPIRRWSAVGHVVRDLEPVCRVFGDVLGFTPEWDKPRDVGEEGVLMQRFRLAAGPAVEVVEPVREGSILADRLEAAGPGVAYLALEAEDLDAMVSRLSDQEAWLTTAPAGESLPRRVWVHARSTDGLPVMLTQGS